MNNIKSIKWGYGVVIALVLGLSGCYMDNQSAQEVTYSNESAPTMYKKQTTAGNASSATVQQKSSSVAKEPTQKSTPGPKRTAAPQLPVIE